MISSKQRFLLFLAVFHLAKSQRRIKGGQELSTNKGYVVYLVKAPSSPREYDAWICGGAIVSREFIVTSAACVEDVQHMYAIAGYKKYVPSKSLDSDQCTQQMKKKVIFTCVPKAYDFDYAKIEKWSYIDIAVVKVESPYDFNDEKYTTLCSYAPKEITINYEIKLQEPGIDSMVLGWGHLDKWRKPEDTTDYNQEGLRFAPTLIHDKNECKKFFTSIPALDNVIDKYMICTLEQGNIDASGDLILKSRPVADGCTPKVQRLMAGEIVVNKYMICTLDQGNIDASGGLILKSKPVADGCTPKVQRLMAGEIVCEEDETVLIDDTRRTFSNILSRQINRTRRQGFCQNDHGGPLVTWVGGHEILIGVASVFRVTDDSLCTGPYLYTSTQCNGAFLDCVINGDDKTRRRAICDKDPSEKGFDTIERHISWLDHPEGPADNEKIMMRPQAPINQYYNWDKQINT